MEELKRTVKIKKFEAERLRKQAGLTQKQLIDELYLRGCDISHSTVRKIERGESVKRKYVEALCDFFSVSLPSLVANGERENLPLLVSFSAGERQRLSAQAKKVGLPEEAFAKQVLLCACGYSKTVDHIKSMLKVVELWGTQDEDK